jgi:hypothetical protein
MFEILVKFNRIERQRQGRSQFGLVFEVFELFRFPVLKIRAFTLPCSLVNFIKEVILYTHKNDLAKKTRKEI